MIIHNIDAPEEWQSTNDWDSHRPALWLALQNTTGPVTEFGCGYGSTPLLAKYCKEHDRLFFSYETNKEWADRFGIATKMDNYNQIHLSEFPHRQGLLFIDSAPGEERKSLIAKYADHAEVIVIHDSEILSSYVYDLEPILAAFKHRIDYCPPKKPHTSIVSNYINLQKEWKMKFGEN